MALFFKCCQKFSYVPYVTWMQLPEPFNILFPFLQSFFISYANDAWKLQQICACYCRILLLTCLCHTILPGSLLQCLSIACEPILIFQGVYNWFFAFCVLFSVILRLWWCFHLFLSELGKDWMFHFLGLVAFFLNATTKNWINLLSLMILNFEPEPQNVFFLFAGQCFYITN